MSADSSGMLTQKAPYGLRGSFSRERGEPLGGPLAGYIILEQVMVKLKADHPIPVAPLKEHPYRVYKPFGVGLCIVGVIAVYVLTKHRSLELPQVLPSLRMSTELRFCWL